MALERSAHPFGSIMPNITTGNTQAPCVILGEPHGRTPQGIAAHLYCTENNVSIAPRYTSDHSNTINLIAPIGAKVPQSMRRGRGLSKLRQWHRIAAGNERRTEMSTALSTLFQPAATLRPGRYVWRLLHAWARDIANHVARRAALKHLGEFNDRELRDIGLARSQVEAAVYGFITRPDPGRM